MAKKKKLKPLQSRSTPQLGMSARRMSKSEEAALANKTAKSSMAVNASRMMPELGSAKNIGKRFASDQAKPRATTKANAANRNMNLKKNPAWGRDVPLPKSK